MSRVLDALQRPAEIRALHLRPPRDESDVGLTLDLELTHADGDTTYATFRNVYELKLEPTVTNLPVDLEVRDMRQRGWEANWLVTELGEELIRFRCSEISVDGEIV